MSMGKQMLMQGIYHGLPDLLAVADVNILFKFRLSTIVSIDIFFYKYRLQRSETKDDPGSEKAVHNCQTYLGYKIEGMLAMKRPRLTMETRHTDTLSGAHFKGTGSFRQPILKLVGPGLGHSHGPRCPPPLGRTVPRRRKVSQRTIITIVTSFTPSGASVWIEIESAVSRGER